MNKSLGDQIADKLKKPISTFKKLQKKTEKKVQPVTDTEISIGSIVYLPMSANDSGFVVKNGAVTADKMNVIVGFSDDYWAVATVLINTNSDESTDDLADCQFPLNAEDYKGILKHNSTLNCASIFEISKNRIKAEGNYKGALIDKDLSSAIKCIEETILITPKEKRRYGIEDKSKQ